MGLINPNWGPDPLNRLTDRPPRRGLRARYEIHDIFREMVRQELSKGELSSRRRRKLVRYATSLRLSVTEAGQLIQEAMRADAAARAADPHAGRQDRLRLRPAPRPTRDWSTAVKLLLVVATALLIKVILTALLSGQ